MVKKLTRAFIFGLMLLGLVGVVSADENPDPWEGFNRKVFAFNDFLDRNILRPAAVGYDAIVPPPVDRAVSNVFSNANDTFVVVNDVAQFKWTQALSDTARFIVNTTVGFFGVFDVASSIGLPKHREDLGQTLGYWGVGTGPYLMLPFIGPSTLRDGVGRAGEYATGLSYNYVTDSVAEDTALFVLDAVDTRAGLLNAEGFITGDRYTFIRSAYLQSREFLVNDGEIEDEFEEDFGDDFDIFEDFE